MMSTHLYLGFILASLVTLSIPGPNLLLILARSTTAGTSAGLATVAGMTLAQILQILTVALGLSWVVQVYPATFEIIQFGGAAYLIYLGVRHWMAAGRSPSHTRCGRHHFQTGFFVGIANPKSLLFIAAFFPQFIDDAQSAGQQLAILGVTYILLAIVLDGLFAIFLGKARSKFRGNPNSPVIEKVSSVLLVGAGFLLIFFQ